MSSFADYLGVEGTTRPLKIGSSFSWKETPYHSIRCDFKPASVDVNQAASLEVGDNNDVSLSVPLEGEGVTNFQGSQKCHLKECVLIIDHSTGEITLERLGSQIQLKKTRNNPAPKGSRPPYPFNKNKLSPMSGCGTPTRNSTSPASSSGTSSKPSSSGRAKPPRGAPKVASMPVLDQSSSSSDEESELEDHTPNPPAAVKPVAAPPPPPQKPSAAAATDSSDSSESESSSSSSSSDDSSDDDDDGQQGARAPAPQNMPVIGDDLILPSAPVMNIERNILTQDLQLSDTDSDSD